MDEDRFLKVVSGFFNPSPSPLVPIWTFGISGVTAASFVNMYWIVLRLTRGQSWAADDPTACGQASRISKVLLWTPQ